MRFLLGITLIHLFLGCAGQECESVRARLTQVGGDADEPVNEVGAHWRARLSPELANYSDYPPSDPAPHYSTMPCTPSTAPTECGPPSDRGQKRPNCHLRPGRRINQSHRRVTHIPRPSAGNQQIFLIETFLSDDPKPTKGTS